MEWILLRNMEWEAILMKKRILSLLLTLALAMGLSAPALADGLGETRVGFRFN